MFKDAHFDAHSIMQWETDGGLIMRDCDEDMTSGSGSVANPQEKSDDSPESL